jgi:hypothetical protein
MRRGRRIWSTTSTADLQTQLCRLCLHSEALAKECAARLPLPWSHYVTLSGVRSINARAFCESEALCGGCTRSDVWLDRMEPLAKSAASELAPAGCSQALTALHP